MASFDIDAWQSGIGYPKCNDEPSLEGTCFQSYWTELSPALQQQQQGSKYLSFDGFSFHGRMAILKYLIYELDGTIATTEQRNDLRVYHWLWAYGAQMDWQHRSGRFSAVGLVKGGKENDQDSSTDRISTESWWGYMNFCFIVCILLGAERAGLLKHTILLDDESKELIENDEAVRGCIDGWTEFYRESYSCYKKKVSKNSISDIQCEMAHFELQKEVWKAHTAVIHATVGTDMKNSHNHRMKELLQLIPEPEQRFALGWCRMVGLLDALCFPTDLRTLLEDGAGRLPIEIVSDDQLAQWKTAASAKKLSEVDLCRLATIENMHKLAEAPERALQIMSMFYRRIVQSPEIARSMPQRVIQISYGTDQEKRQETMRLVGLFLKPTLSFLQPQGKEEYIMMVGIVALFGLVVHHNYM